MSYTLGYHEDGPDSYVIAVGGFPVTDDPDSPFGTPATSAVSCSRCCSSSS